MTTEPLLFPLPDYGHYGCEILAWDACVVRLEAELIAIYSRLDQDTSWYDSFRSDVVDEAHDAIFGGYSPSSIRGFASRIRRHCRDDDGFYSGQIRDGRSVASLLDRWSVAIDALTEAQRDRLQTLRAT